MADPRNEVTLPELNKLLNDLKAGTFKIVHDLEVEMAKASKKLQKQESQEMKRVLDDLADYRTRGIIKNETEAAEYVEARKRTLSAQRYEEDLEDEIKILKEMSKANEIERKKRQRQMEEERDILKLKNAGKDKEAKQKQKEKDNREEKERIKETRENFDFGSVFKEQFREFREEIPMKTLADDLVKTMKGIGRAINDGINKVNAAIDTYSSYQTAINTRLREVSSFGKAIDTLSSVAYSPLINTENLYSNLSELVNEGIVTNVEQRAFFATVKDGIATTFDVNSEYLRRMIKLQRDDSTAARLGLESYLTRFLNVYVENTEYLTSTFDQVASSLFEASALLGAQGGSNASLQFEYVVQKWLGSLTGVGFSESTAQSLAEAIGQLGSGNVDALADSAMQNLLIMAANRAGLDYGQMLSEGMSATQTNSLIEAVVGYLQELAGYSTNIVKNQLSKVFGVTTSDLIAVANLSKEALQTIKSDILTREQMYGELYGSFSTLAERVGPATILNNLFKNFVFQTGMDIGSSPAMYATWAITDLIQSVTGGINIPYISAMGTGIDLNASVENLIKLGLIGISTLGNIGNIASGYSSVGDGSKLLSALKISASTSGFSTFGGTGLSSRASGVTASEGEVVGQSSSDVYSDEAVGRNKQSAQEELNQAKKDEGNAIADYFMSKENIADDFFKERLALIEQHTESIDNKTTKSSDLSSLFSVNPDGGSSGIKIDVGMVDAAAESQDALINIESALRDLDFATSFKLLVSDVHLIKDTVTNPEDLIGNLTGEAFEGINAGPYAGGNLKA